MRTTQMDTTDADSENKTSLKSWLDNFKQWCEANQKRPLQETDIETLFTELLRYYGQSISDRFELLPPNVSELSDNTNRREASEFDDNANRRIEYQIKWPFYSVKVYAILNYHDCFAWLENNSANSDKINFMPLIICNGSHERMIYLRTKKPKENATIETENPMNVDEPQVTPSVTLEHRESAQGWYLPNLLSKQESVVARASSHLLWRHCASTSLDSQSLRVFFRNQDLVDVDAKNPEQNKRDPSPIALVPVEDQYKSQDIHLKEVVVQKNGTIQSKRSWNIKLDTIKSIFSKNTTPEPIDIVDQRLRHGLLRYNSQQGQLKITEITRHHKEASIEVETCNERNNLRTPLLPKR